MAAVYHQCPVAGGEIAWIFKETEADSHVWCDDCRRSVFIPGVKRGPQGELAETPKSK